MKLSELMIGDWVYVEKFGKPIRVESVGYTAFVGYEHFQEIDGSIYGIKPIELTEEILEKNGWILKEFGCHKQFQYSFEDYGTEIVLKIDYEKPNFIVSFFRATFALKYVNELQHMLKLCGIEKEIVL